MNIVAIDMVEKDCDRCGGSGRVPVFGLGLITERCPKCLGKGYIFEVEEDD